MKLPPANLYTILLSGICHVTSKKIAELVITGQTSTNEILLYIIELHIYLSAKYNFDYSMRMVRYFLKIVLVTVV